MITVRSGCGDLMVSSFGLCGFDRMVAPMTTQIVRPCQTASRPRMTTPARGRPTRRMPKGLATAPIGARWPY